jgi:hypothetical protein
VGSTCMLVSFQNEVIGISMNVKYVKQAST